MEPTETQQTIRFGRFELHPTGGELRKDGRLIRIQPQPLRLLALLVRRAGSIVSREEIRQELWPDGTFVEFDQSVNFTIRQVREALGDQAEQPLYVETVPRRGYRFIAPVESAPVPPAADLEAVVRLDKALWENVAELRLAQARRRRYAIITLSSLAAVGLLAFIIATIW